MKGRPAPPRPAAARPVPVAAKPAPTVILHPGDVQCVDRGHRMETLLGSCVALILTDPRRTVGAMCHVVHAKPPLAGLHASTAHGDAALAHLSAMLRARGIEPRLCEAWVFGGGNMFPHLVGAQVNEGNVGAANAAWALDRLGSLGLTLLGHDLGGNGYRRVGWTVGAGAPEVTTVPI